MLADLNRRFPILTRTVFFLPVFGLVTAVYLARPDGPALAQCNYSPSIQASLVNDGKSFRRGFNVNCDNKVASYNLSYDTGPLGKSICGSAANNAMFQLTYPTASAGKKGMCVWKLNTTAGATYRFGLRIGSTVPFELTPDAMEEAGSSEGEGKQ